MIPKEASKIWWGLVEIYYAKISFIVDLSKMMKYLILIYQYIIHNKTYFKVWCKIFFCSLFSKGITQVTCQISELYVISSQRYWFLSATEYHSDADYNSRRVGVVVVVVVVRDFKKWITFLCFDRFGSYLVGSCTRVRRFTSYPIFVIRPTQPAQPAYRPKSEKRA